MGLLKWTARKGNVGGTARWVAKAFKFAIANELINTNNCKNRSGALEECGNVVMHALQVRFDGNMLHPHAEAIGTYYYSTEGGLTMLTASILAVEAALFENDDETVSAFMEVIQEELEKEGVGHLFL